MKTYQTTHIGTLHIGSIESLFTYANTAIEATVANASEASVALTGGSTPKAFYDWATKHQALSDRVKAGVVWTVSDERMVALDDPESNFGNADIKMLQPLGIDVANKFPWPVQVDPHSAAVSYQRNWVDRFGPAKAYDLCFLGMGDDGHTASIFPGSHLLNYSTSDSFTSVDVPGKGWRLTLTPEGFKRCGRIVVMVTGANKASVLKAVLEGPSGVYPIQLLRSVAEKVEWLVDEAAAAELNLA